jgi:aspartate/methionine/tyrosine aminotransferase
MRRLNDLFSNNTAHPSERIAARALDHAGELLAEVNALLERNRATVDAFVRERDELSWVRPSAGTIGFVSTDGVDVDALTDRLYTEYDVAIVPGRFFGARDHFRVSFGLPPDDLGSALERVGRALDRAR